MSWITETVGGAGKNFGIAYKEFMIESEADLTNPDFDGNKPDTAPGSVAYTADFSVFVKKDIDGSWKTVGG